MYSKSSGYGNRQLEKALLPQKLVPLVFLNPFPDVCVLCLIVLATKSLTEPIICARYFMSKNERLKIAFVTQPIFGISFPCPQDSIGIWTYEVGCRLVQSAQITIYTPGRFRKQIFSHEQVDCHYLPTGFEKFSFDFLSKRLKLHKAKLPVFASRFYALGYAWQIAQELRKYQYDIVHIHNFSQLVPIIRYFNPKIKIVLHMHCEWLTQLDSATIERRLQPVDLIIGCSNHITNKIRQKFPQFAGRCRTVFNGVNISKFDNDDNHKTQKDEKVKQLLFIGRVSPEKGVHVLLEAFQKVVYYYPQVQLKLVGSVGSAPFEFIIGLSDDPEVLELASFYQGDYFSHLQEKITSDIAERVSFTGFVPQSQLAHYYRKADVLINPSLSEAFGMSLVEAMATEVPVIGTRVGGMTDIIEHGKTGLLVEPADAPALANTIVQLLFNEKLRKSMGKAGRQRVLELFSWEQVSESLLNHYENIC